MFGRDGKIHTSEVNAESLFHAAEHAVKNWRVLWWYWRENAVNVQVGLDNWVRDIGTGSAMAKRKEPEAPAHENPLKSSRADTCPSDSDNQCGPVRARFHLAGDGFLALERHHAVSRLLPSRLFRSRFLRRGFWRPPLFPHCERQFLAPVLIIPVYFVATGAGSDSPLSFAHRARCA
jgi:hypothetical protein